MRKKIEEILIKNGFKKYSDIYSHDDTFLNLSLDSSKQKLSWGKLSYFNDQKMDEIKNLLHLLRNDFEKKNINIAIINEDYENNTHPIIIASNDIQLRDQAFEFYSTFFDSYKRVLMSLPCYIKHQRISQLYILDALYDFDNKKLHIRTNNTDAFGNIKPRNFITIDKIIALKEEILSPIQQVFSVTEIIDHQILRLKPPFEKTYVTFIINIDTDNDNHFINVTFHLDSRERKEFKLDFNSRLDFTNKAEVAEEFQTFKSQIEIKNMFS